MHGPCRGQEINSCSLLVITGSDQMRQSPRNWNFCRKDELKSRSCGFSFTWSFLKTSQMPHDPELRSLGIPSSVHINSVLASLWHDDVVDMQAQGMSTRIWRWQRPSYQKLHDDKTDLWGPSICLEVCMPTAQRKQRYTVTSVIISKLLKKQESF